MRMSKLCSKKFSLSLLILHLTSEEWASVMTQAKCNHNHHHTCVETNPKSRIKIHCVLLGKSMHSMIMSSILSLSIHSNLQTDKSAFGTPSPKWVKQEPSFLGGGWTIDFLKSRLIQYFFTFFNVWVWSVFLFVWCRS